MEMKDLNELKRLTEECKKSSPSPWFIRRFSIIDRKDIPIHHSVSSPIVTQYIAAADPATVLGLIAEVERLRKVEAAAKRLLEEWPECDARRDGVDLERAELCAALEGKP